MGFTLIELLVVISIIGILISIAIVSLTSVQKRARDGQRKSDLKQLQSSLEMYYSNNNAAYPTAGSFLWGQPWSYNGVNYLRKVPSDLLPSRQYCYERSNSISYTLCAMLENLSDPDIRPLSACGYTYNYCLQNPL